MAVIVYPNTFAPNTLASAAEVNANFDAITDQVNGNLGPANLATDAVTTVKIVDGAVTADKIAADAVSTAKVPDSAITPVKTSFLGTNVVGVYFGRIATDGTARSLPSGWSSSRSGTVGDYTYNITHNLGTTQIGIIVTPLNPSIPRFGVNGTTGGVVRLYDGVSSYINDEFSFVLFHYA